jgi:hypothetical protein
MTKDNKKPFEEEFTEMVEAPEVKTPVEIKTVKVKVSSKDKVKATVTAISKGWLFLADEKENGYKIRITEEYKKYKVGDIITL